MLIDVTLKITPDMIAVSQKNTAKELVGHIGTHFDVMDKEFPLEYTKRKGIVFDVSTVSDGEIDLGDIDIDSVEKESFVAFYTGYIEREEYGTHDYFALSPQLSHRLIDALLEKGISIIGIDFPGIRRGREHVPKDRLCADKNVFVIENLANLKAVLNNGGAFTAHTYPMRCHGMTGLPCRVIVEV